MLVLLMLAMAANGVVNRPVANLYAGPDDDNAVVSQTIYGTNVAILEEKDGWVRIQTSDEYSGWARSAELLRTSAYGHSVRVARVDGLFANIYRETSITKHAPIVTVPFETRLEVVSEPAEAQRRWIQVRLPDDHAGWVQRGDVSFDEKPLSIPQTISLAKRFLGLPYLWGGTSSFGYDCSGYVQMLCRRRGRILPRDAGPQASSSVVKEIAKAKLAPGDLLFFGPNRMTITHTGMYIGHGQFIHATANKRPVIQISQLSEPRWTKLLVACRRLK